MSDKIDLDKLGEEIYAGFTDIYYKGEKVLRDVDAGVEYWVVKKWYLPLIQRLYWNHKAKKGGFSYHFWSGKMLRGNFNIDVDVKKSLPKE
jgi:hypothetical protein